MNKMKGNASPEKDPGKPESAWKFQMGHCYLPALPAAGNSLKSMAILQRNPKVGTSLPTKSEVLDIYKHTYIYIYYTIKASVP